MFPQLTNNHWLMLLLGIFILWYFYNMSSEGFYGYSRKRRDIEQSGRKKWKYMYDWIHKGRW